MKTNFDIGLLIIRLIIAIPMLFYGVGKLIYGIDFIQQLLAGYNLPSLMGYGVYVGEVIAPLMIIIGYRTRLAGIIFSVNCLIALLLTQSQNVFELNEYGGWALEQLSIFTLIPLALFFTGAGKLALSYNSKWD